MGGTPKTAMNLVGFPIKRMDIDVLRRIIQGGIDKMKEAEVVLIGGHSVEDDELKYGFSVTGFIHPRAVLTKRNLKAGDSLLLTKPLGTGIINTAAKGGVASPEDIDTVGGLMAMLNRKASEVMKNYPVHACTDVTGFGLIGHLAEMVAESELSVRLHADRIPIIPGVREYAGMGLIPAGAYKNMTFRQDMVTFSSTIDSLLQIILNDPQTSGGLLICLESEKAERLKDELKQNGVSEAECIGKVVPAPAGKIFVD